MKGDKIITERVTQEQLRSGKLPRQVPSDAFEALTEAIGTPMRRVSKYNNKKTTVDGITFDSKLEAEHWTKLKALEAAGEITELQRQVAFPCVVDRTACRRVYRSTESYVADFMYRTKEGSLVVVDTKGMKTDEYKRKKKWVEELYGLRVLEARK